MGSPVFKTGEGLKKPLAGSIPVRLRDSHGGSGGLVLRCRVVRAASPLLLSHGGSAGLVLRYRVVRAASPLLPPDSQLSGASPEGLGWNEPHPS